MEKGLSVTERGVTCTHKKYSLLTNALEHPNSEAAKDKKGRKAVERLPDIKRNDSLSASWCSESGGSNSAVSSPLCGISDNSICSLQERDGGQYGLLDKLSLAALTKAASKCLNLDNIVIDVTRNSKRPFGTHFEQTLRMHVQKLVPHTF